MPPAWPETAILTGHLVPSSLVQYYQARRVHLADIIATVMHEHGQSTPRFVALAQRGTAGELFAWRRAR